MDDSSKYARTDMEIAIFLAMHLENPCGCFVNGEYKHIREFYMREAENILSRMRNPFAIEYLRLIISGYK
ncbi:MAG TPA: hypothetical protein VJH65_03510 [Candidatus Nanoarchaeia archaeon]|nr:hypothetical protein [Candidatus Nanoarchaeia archaeon]